MANELLRCRIFGHAWDEVPVGAVIDSYTTPLDYRIVIALRCMRCGTARLDSWNRWGSLGARKYIYPDDYKNFNQDLRENHKPDDSVWIEAKKRYLKAGREAAKASDQEQEGAADQEGTKAQVVKLRAIRDTA